VRVVREDDSFEPSPNSSSEAQQKPSRSPSSELRPRVVRVEGDGARSESGSETRKVRCYRCPSTEPPKPVKELTLGLCEKHWTIREERARRELLSYLSGLREYAAATGDTRASDYADYVEECEIHDLDRPNDPRQVTFYQQRVREDVEIWRHEQRGL